MAVVPGWESWSGWNITPSGPGGYDYYDPNSTYGQTKYGNQYAQNAFTNTGAGYWYMNQNDDAAWTRYAAPFMSGSGEGNFDRWLQSQKGRVYDAFQAALATNPNLNFYGEFLPGLGGYDEWMQRYQALSPEQRGENAARYAGSARWIPRL